MKLTTYAQTLHDLNLIKDQGLDEVILGHMDFSRFGKLSNDEFIQFSKRAQELKLRVIFEWDILMTENTFKKLKVDFLNFQAYSDSIRVQDPGALEWCLKNSLLPLQFIAENGNHNALALQSWVEYAAGRMERIVLSIELPRTVIEDYTEKLNVPCELLGLGRILLFYTPRLLLSPLVEAKQSYYQELSAVGESEESPHKGFPVIENHHGTFMFHIKDFCLLDYLSDLQKTKLSHLRIDLRWTSMELLKDVRGDAEAFKEKYPQDLMRGFYLVNKTDVLFPKLKNHRLQQREGDYIGEVIEAEKSSHLAIIVKNNRGLKKSDKLKILHPKGEEFEVGIYSLRNLALDEVDLIPAGATAIIQFVGGVWVKSQVFYQN